jgi:hypothetical protein
MGRVSDMVGFLAAAGRSVPARVAPAAFQSLAPDNNLRRPRQYVFSSQQTRRVGLMVTGPSANAALHVATALAMNNSTATVGDLEQRLTATCNSDFAA